MVQNARPSFAAPMYQGRVRGSKLSAGSCTVSTTSPCASRRVQVTRRPPSRRSISLLSRPPFCVARDVEEIAVRIGVAEARDLREVAERREHERLGRQAAVEHAAFPADGARRFEELLGRREIGAHLDGDALIDRVEQIVGQRNRAAAVGVVDVGGDQRRRSP